MLVNPRRTFPQIVRGDVFQNGPNDASVGEMKRLWDPVKELVGRANLPFQQQPHDPAADATTQQEAHRRPAIDPAKPEVPIDHVSALLVHLQN
jgi:hypothetical protein